MSASDTFFKCMFWFLMILGSALFIWEALAAFANYSADSEEPDEWDKLSEAEKAELRLWTKN